jgi:acetoacetyl-CoA synthetase
MTRKSETLRDGASVNGSSPVSREEAQQATMHLFRSIRAGRAWVRDHQTIAPAPQHAACVTMRAGDGSPPIFMLPGAPGSVLQLGPLAAALPGTMPVYAIKPRGLEKGEAPCESIAEMAEYSIDAIRAVWPRDPYLLVGYSAGGLVALETAQQLTAAGEEVQLLVLIDTSPSRRSWPLRCHAEILARLTWYAFRSLWQYKPSELTLELRRGLGTFFRYLAESGVTVLPSQSLPAEGWSGASRRLYEATYKAGESYRPARYRGKVVYMQPETLYKLQPRSPELAWRKYLTDLKICKVPGSHLGMLQSGSTVIGEQIGDALAQALGSPHSRPGSLDQGSGIRQTGTQLHQPSMGS